MDKLTEKLPIYDILKKETQKIENFMWKWLNKIMMCCDVITVQNASKVSPRNVPSLKVVPRSFRHIPASSREKHITDKLLMISQTSVIEIILFSVEILTCVRLVKLF